MRDPILTIDYQVGSGRVRRRLAREWPCPLCGSTLEAAEHVAARAVRTLHCPECQGKFRIVKVAMPEAQPKRAWDRKRRPPSSSHKAKKDEEG